ncbi:dihydrolipoamide acetyltransferase family protein [Cnuibacter physcomitrellae]|uniref:dihydrolipoamide acetyltransferase family protein n=1 Tax=Cnuibacter physcomitrellae TaxID=1619308 RepID=UPI00287792CC|nr:dihydrolipoamide acetyltransferase family protein [Cnuibacter physcomitrellae]
MATIIRMPSVLAGADEAAIASWLVNAGDTVAVGDPLAEIETEKAVVEYTAEESGTVGRIVLEAGASSEIGAPIAVLLADGEGDADIDAVLGSAAPGSDGGQAEAGEETAPTVATPEEDPESGAPEVEADSVRDAAGAAAGTSAAVVTAESGPVDSAGTDDQGRRFASPIARKLARSRGLDLAALSGTGPDGRIVRRDVERAAAGDSPAPGTAPAASASRTGPAASAASAAPVAAPPAPAAASASADGDDDLIPHTPMRKAIARRLTESKATVPHFYLTADCRVDELLALRARINASSPRRVSVNDLVVKAVAAAFTDVPDANVTWTDSGMRVHRSVDISVAVATEGGLLTPVVRDVGRASVTEVSRQIADLAERARDRKLRQDELEGGSFSVSNLGMFGTLEFAAILNPPQSGILAVGAAKKQPVVVDDELAIATVMRVTLSVDHRAVDGALAAQWLGAFVERIEDPLSIVI